MVQTRELETIGSRRQVILLHDKLFPLYIVRGDRNFLIDSGPAVYGDIFHERITHALNTFGTSAGERIDTLLLTHTHWDHTGAAYHLQREYGFNIMASRQAVKLLEKSKVTGFIDRLNEGYRKMMNVASDIRFGQLENMEMVKEGDRIPVDSESYFEVIETPGHTKCSVTFLLHPDRILFHGDTAGLRERDNSIKPLFLSNYDEYEGSLKRLIDIEAEVLAFPHNRFIKGKEKVKTYLRDSLARTRHVKEEILKILQGEQDTKKVAEILYEREFPEPSLLGPKESFVISLEAMVKAVR